MQGPSFYRLALGVITVAAIAVAGCDAPDPRAGGDPQAAPAGEAVEDATTELAPVNRSGVTGTVEVERDDGEIEVSIALEGLDAGAAYPANLYEGRCAAGGAIAAPLGRVTARDDGTGGLNSRVAPPGLGASTPVFLQVETADGEAVACGDLGGDAGAPITDRLETDTAAESGEGGA